MKIVRILFDIVMMFFLFVLFGSGIYFWLFGIIDGKGRELSLSQSIKSVYEMCLGLGLILIPVVLLIFYVIFSSNVKIVRLIRKYRTVKRKVKSLRKKPSEE